MDDDSGEDKFTKNQIEEFREVFNIFDKTDNGYITKNDINTVLKSLGQTVSDEEMLNLLKSLDREDESDDNIYFRHFMKIIAARVGKIDGKKDIVEAFQIFDRDSCGKLSVQELRYLLSSDSSLTQDEINDLFMEADEGQEGFIEYGKYLNMILDCFK